MLQRGEGMTLTWGARTAGEDEDGGERERDLVDAAGQRDWREALRVLGRERGDGSEIPAEHLLQHVVRLAGLVKVRAVALALEEIHGSACDDHEGDEDGPDGP